MREAGLPIEEAQQKASHLTPVEAFHVAEEAPILRHGGSDPLLVFYLVITAVALISYLIYGDSLIHLKPTTPQARPLGH